VHEKRIEIRWRDLDALAHVNNTVYLVYLEEVRTAWLAEALNDNGDVWSYVLARVAIDFRRELALEDEAVVVRCSLAAIGRSSVRTNEEIRTESGELAARAEAVIVARDPETGASRPLSDAERSALG
jgi:acyl-CoA thioester hydrolase